MLPSARYALHPYWPVRLGFRAALRVVNREASLLLSKTDGFSLAPARVRIAILRECRDVVKRGVKGDFVEFGVHRGGTAAILASAILDEPKRHLHLFDRWGDLPEPTSEDGFRTQTHRRADRLDKIAELHDTRESAVRAVEVLAGFPRDRVSYYQGWFNDTVKDYPGNPIAFASIDTDYYDSTVPVLALCGHYASPRATFFIDDYATWPGARQATHEFVDTTKRKTRLSVLPTGNAIIHFLD